MVDSPAVPGNAQYDLQFLSTLLGQTINLDGITYGEELSEPGGAEAKKTVSFVLNGETGFSYDLTPVVPVAVRSRFCSMVCTWDTAAAPCRSCSILAPQRRNCLIPLVE